MPLMQLLHYLTEMMRQIMRDFVVHQRSVVEIMGGDGLMNSRKIGILRAIRDELILMRKQLRRGIVELIRWVRLIQRGARGIPLPAEVVHYILDLRTPFSNVLRALQQSEQNIDNFIGALNNFLADYRDF